MAEKLVSPGVFTYEKDASFLPTGVGQIGGALIGPTKKGPAFRPTVVSSYQEFIDIFGDLDSSTYLPYAAKAYLRSAGSATIIRIMTSEDWSQTNAYNLIANSKVVATLVPTIGNTGTTLTLAGTVSSFSINSPELTGLSFNPTSSNYIGNLFSTSPAATGSGLTGQYYLYRFFPVAAEAATGNVTAQAVSNFFTDANDNSQYRNAKTPWVTSQLSTGQAFDLFQFGRLSDGTEGNYDVKVTIEDIRKAGTVPGTDYAVFNVFVRRVGGFLGSTDSDTKTEVLESFLNVDMDPYSENYILKRIGDSFSEVSQDGRVNLIGDFPNKSKYIYVIPANGFDNLPAGLYPFGFKKPNSTIPFGGTNALGTTIYVTQQGSNDIYDNRYLFGFDFYSTDQKQLLYSIPDGPYLVPTSPFATDFNLDNMFAHPSSSATGIDGTAFAPNASLSSSNAPTEMLKFAIPMQGGHDGMPYNRKKNVGQDITAGNVFGFDCTAGNSSGSLAYIKALNILSNADEYDINLIVTPGIINSLHPDVTSRAIEVCTNRGDAFYIMDGFPISSSVSEAVASISDLDTNYAAVYYPWVKVQDTVSKKYIWVPPSVAVAGVYAQNDTFAYEWFAPAGLNRGGIPEATQVYSRLTNAERDQLYLNRINPIAQFPNAGITVWGQKTLQARASALDRINVRRLLIATKKYIASATKYLVFEQNNTQTRNRFLNIVNPYLESVKSRQGLYAFKAVMDETLNTPDLIDRNILYGQIYLQPTRTAEFIIIDFNIQATGASFSNA
jgi:phage tail sheath protein FI